jgi:amino acid transporter
MNSNYNYSKLNPLNPELDKSKQYKRILDFPDLFSAGYSFIIGSGIFILLPMIIKFSGGISWISFIIGCLICLFTGLSYSKLNMIFPTNDAEYAWILNVLNFDKARDPKKINLIVKSIANIVIWIIFFIGVFTSATVLVCQSNFIKEYINLDKKLIITCLSVIPVIINVFGAKTATHFNKAVIVIISTLFGVVLKYAISDGTHFNELVSNEKPSFSMMKNLFNSSFITLFLYNGFQSLVQLSEEAKHQEDIPKSLISSLLFSAILYSVFTISVIALLGAKVASKSNMTLVDALKVVLSNKKVNIINIIVIIILTNTVVIISLSRSRLLQKMSVRGIAPNIFKSLGNENEINKDTNPINAIIGVGLITFLSTFIKEGSIETLASLTNIFILISFFMVNALMIVFYLKKKTIDELEKQKISDTKIPQLKGVPWYSVIGVIMSITYLLKYPKLDIGNKSI